VPEPINSKSTMNTVSTRCLRLAVRATSSIRNSDVKIIGVAAATSSTVDKINLDVTSGRQTRSFGSKRQAKMSKYIKDLNERAHDKAREEGVARREERKSRKNKEVVEDKVVYNDDEADHEDIDDDDDDDEDYIDLPDPKDLQNRMNNVVESLKESFKSIRGSEPTPELFESITVMAYGNNPTPLASLAQVVITGPTLATLSCYDPSVVSAVRDAVRDALELNPQAGDDGTVVVPMPKPSLETREQVVKQLGKQAEAARQRIRNIRRKANTVLKLGKDGKLDGISKDDVFRVSSEIDKATDKTIGSLNEAVEKKQQSIMAV